MLFAFWRWLDNVVWGDTVFCEIYDAGCTDFQ